MEWACLDSWTARNLVYVSASTATAVFRSRKTADG
jgi:hypothetical protein